MISQILFSLSNAYILREHVITALKRSSVINERIDSPEELTLERNW